MKIEIPYFAERKDLLKWLVQNKTSLIAQKIMGSKMQAKRGDGVPFLGTLYNPKGKAFKANTPVDEDVDELKVKAVINTTNIMDSHSDVHIPGLWDKSLQESAKWLMHLQEHEMSFKNIIAEGDDLKAYTQKLQWRDIDIDLPGKTEALIFESKVRKDRNEFMHEQYAKGRVKNHSVGMQYVKLVLCINDEDYGAEYEAWEKYAPMVINLDQAEDQGYFWAVTEAKAIEGSAVPRGSNTATPTLENNMKASRATTRKREPRKSTQLNYDYLLEKLSI